MPPKGASTKLAPPRLPALSKIRVRRPNAAAESNPCEGIMTSVLACWASTGNSIYGCAAIEQQLRVCMDQPVVKQTGKNTINYHMMRLFPKIRGPRKRD